MTCDFSVVAPESPTYRVARLPDPWAWPDWNRAGPDGAFGNRWDDPQGTYRVLYASSTRFGAFVETLARFRPDLAIVAALSEIDGTGDPIPAGTVPRGWFVHRLIGGADLLGAYVNIGAAESLAVLRARAAGRAIHYGLADIDAAAIRGASRGFTQELSRLVYECQTARGEPFAGIRYSSRLDDASTNWAIFEPSGVSAPPFTFGGAHPIEEDDTDVQRAMAVLGLRLE